MRDAIALLRGWHPALSKSELTSLLPGIEISSEFTTRMLEIGKLPNPEEIEQTLKISAGIEGILYPGMITNWSNLDSLKSCITDFIGTNDIPHGSLKVLSWNHGGNVSGFEHQNICQEIGAILYNHGAKVNLHTPENIFAVVIDNASLTISFGWLHGIGSRFKGQTINKATERPFFKPVSLDPILAKACVNIVSGPLSSELPVIDLMCGTVGFLIEGACSGRNVIGIDADRWMIEGAKKNMTWALDKAGIDYDESKHVLIQGDATLPMNYLDENLIGNLRSIVFDPPYGRNSQGTIEHLNLVRKTLTALAEIVSKESQLIIFLPCEGATMLIDREVSVEDNFQFTYAPNEEVYSMIESSGWRIKSRFFERVHRSLGRMIIHLEVSPQD